VANKILATGQISGKKIENIYQFQQNDIGWSLLHTLQKCDIH